jgi:hypothetical protein
MNVRDDRHRRLSHDLFHRIGSFFVIHGHPHNIDASLGCCPDLRQRSCNVVSLGFRHCLDGNRCICANFHSADKY